jgi:membrane protease YdiL (CAAX protease family)
MADGDDPARRIVVLFALTHLAWVGAWRMAGTLGVWLSLGTVAFVLGAAALWWTPASTRALLRPTPAAIGLGLLSGAVLAGLSHLLYPPIAEVMPSLRPQVETLYGQLHAGPGPVGALPVFITIIVAEELLWRGAFFALAERKMPRWAAAAAVTVPYALAQGGQGTLLLVGVALAVGLVFALVRLLSKELWAPILCHLLWDLVVMVWLPLEPPPV